MTSRLPSRPAPTNNIDNYDVDDDDPFAESGDDATQKNNSTNTNSKKRKDASGLGIDEAVSVSKKPRVPRVKLDENRLLSDDGIPKLRTKAQSLKFKGKGHEFSDTARLLSFYQLWLDDLFPKAKFVDALAMVEKAGHKNRLRLQRIKWIDEGRPRAGGLDNNDDDNDLFGDSNQPEERDPAIFPARIAPMFQNGSDERAKTPAVDDPFEGDIYGASPRQPTTSTSIFGNGGNNEANGDEPDEDDLDALMAEEEAQRTAPTSLFGNGKVTQMTPKQPQQNHDDDDDDLDALMAEAEGASSNAINTQPPNRNPARKIIVDDDEDDLDALIAEAEMAGPAAIKPPSRDFNGAKPKEDPPTDHIDEDEEAAMAEMEGLW
ncbi:hypothetical protein NPX13_g10588 [Xylaria arbuscula]|uniref:Chromosome segregation in meiosis protein n=1 Tax=Xylaria arbuscula TaxID=114810 RepID=A0A9W8N4E8_9PEZI|nr:hypothetical protein NPX13_g10588 [Xylaria arbuscula]